MNNKDLFFKNLETYLDIELSEFDRKRVGGYVDEYVDGLPSKVVYRDVLRNIRERVMQCTDKILLEESKVICEEYGVDLNLFLRSKNGKSTNDITVIRKLFCQRIMDNYQCSHNKLIEFFKVNHATISYYMNGRIPRKKTA